MPGISEAVETGFPHYVTQRGNYQQSVFEDKDGFISVIEGLLGRLPRVLTRGGELARINKWVLSLSNNWCDLDCRKCSI